MKESTHMSSINHFYAQVSHLSCPLIRPKELFYLSELTPCLLINTELLSVSGEIILEEKNALTIFFSLSSLSSFSAMETGSFY